MPTISGVKQNLWRRRQSGLFAPNRMNFPIDGLVLYLPLWHPELSGSPFLSKDLNAHSCTVTGATWGSQGRAFDGTDDYIALGNPAALRLQALTIELWLKRTSLGATGVDAFIGYGAGGWAVYCYENTYSVVGQRNQIMFGKNYNTEVASGLFITDTTTWHHLVVSHSGTVTTFFLDLVSTSTAYAPTFAFTTNCAIGSDGVPAVFSGVVIGEVRVNKRTFVAAEVAHNNLTTKWRYQ